AAEAVKAPKPNDAARPSSPARAAAVLAPQPETRSTIDDHEWMLPVESWKISFKDDVPIHFVNRGQNAAEWDALKGFWTETTGKVIDPKPLEQLTGKAIKIRVPLGLNSNPPVPAENPMTLAKWKLGRQLYFDPILSSDRTISCATCHSPQKGYTDQSMVS